MTEPSSAELLDRFRQRDPTAADELFRRYLDRLVRLAHARLAQRLTARVEADDIVQSAYRSFFRLATTPRVTASAPGDLWRLLAHIALRKISHAVRRHRADRRDVLREQPWPTFDDARALDLPTADPSPAEEAALHDELRSVLAPLDPVHRQIVEMRLLGHDAAAIALAVGRSARAVRRTLASVGQELEQRLNGSPSPAPRVEPEQVLTVAYDEILLRRQVGQGGMGKVYRADWQQRPGVMAVKLLRKPLRGHTLAAERFRAEAEVLARLNHPGIVALRGVGQLPDGGLFLVMDWVDGTDLARRIATGPIALAQALDWVAQAADAIDHAHGRGIVHCDLKPSNLLLDGAGRIRIVDFGLARLLHHHEGAIGGTVGFAAPEQQAGSPGSLSPQTDIYGLASVLVALLTGHPPDDNGVPAVELPEAVAALCRRCLARDPAERPPSAAQVATALARVSCAPPSATDEPEA